MGLWSPHPRAKTFYRGLRSLIPVVNKWICGVHPECGLAHTHRDDLAVSEERRRQMLFAEAQAVASEQPDAEDAKTHIEVRAMRCISPNALC